MAAWNRDGLWLQEGKAGRTPPSLSCLPKVISIAQDEEGVLSQYLLPKAGSPTQGHSTAPI